MMAIPLQGTFVPTALPQFTAVPVFQQQPAKLTWLRESTAPQCVFTQKEDVPAIHHAKTCGIDGIPVDVHSNCTVERIVN